MEMRPAAVSAGPGRRWTLRSRTRRWTGDESGAATVEAVLWLPLFFFIFVLIIDTTMIFSQRAQALRVVQDANRAYAVGRLTEPEQVADFVKARLSDVSPSAIVYAEPGSGTIMTAVSMPAAELDAVGLITTFADIWIMVKAHHLTEL